MAEPQPAGVAPAFEIRHRLERALEVSGLTRDQIAGELGVHRNTIGNYLNGKYVPRSVPREACPFSHDRHTGCPYITAAEVSR